jgi:uncharacterized protein YbjT (DUF2867 family)
VIHLFGDPQPPIPRLISALGARGHRLVAEAGGARAPRSTLVLGAGAALDPLAIGVLLGAWRRTEGARVLVVSALGAHPDAAAPRLRALWQVEETARATRIPSLVLRLAPLVGPDSPLWRRLRSRPRLGRAERLLVQPVAESDVVDTIDRALNERAAWEGWYELAGRDVLTLGELAGIAAAAPPTARGDGTWEPPLAEIEEHRIAEPEPWLEHFGIALEPIATQAARWAA